MNNISHKENRIWFLQLCRAIACLLIVFIHWISFFKNPNALLVSLNLPNFTNYPDITQLTEILYYSEYYFPSSYRETYFGIGLFFLISGFVIPFSMEKVSPFEFLFRRVMRIYPAVLVCVLMAAVLLFCAEFISSTNTDVTLQRIIGNILLSAEQLHVRFIEYGLWTLEIEIRFYFLCFLFAFFSGQKRALALILAPAVSSIAFGSIYAAYISFMLVGTCLFNWHKENWSGKKTLFLIAILMIINRDYLIQYYSLSIDSAGVIYANHIYCLLFFVILLLLNHKLPYSKVMDKVANISYSLYLIHGTASYAIYYWSYTMTNNIVYSVIAALSWIIFASLFVHRYIEKPSIQISKKIILWVKEKQTLYKSSQSEVLPF